MQAAARESWLEKLKMKRITISQIPDVSLTEHWGGMEDGMVMLTLEADLPRDIAAGRWQVCLEPDFAPDFFWTPHLTPDPDSVVDMHVFRTPALMMGKGEWVLCAFPVMDGVKIGDSRYFMDLNAPAGEMTFGLTTTESYDHVLYRATDRVVLPKGRFCYRLILMLQKGKEATENPFRAVLDWYWKTYGSAQSGNLPSYQALWRYVERTYDWAFRLWRRQMWQEFTVEGVLVGAPQFIVTVRQSERYGEPYSIREHVSIWNQAWFCSLRSALGLYRYALRKKDAELLEKARMTKELALSFPQADGLFDSVVAVPDKRTVIDGKECVRGGDWQERYYGNSDRNPLIRDIAKAPRHILDMSWTALQMLQWYRELERDERLLAYVTSYTERLLALQDEDGYYPAWIDKESGRILEELRQSPESAVSARLMLEMYELTRDGRCLSSAVRCLEALCMQVLPEGRWEDFETYWSCSSYGAKTLLGKKCGRNQIHKQCTLSPFYMADALLKCHEVTGEDKYLRWGRRCLDEMLMQQSSFQPGYVPIPVVGGFGVMNCDAELNDARQSLFAELIIRYGRVLDVPEYVERGYAALRASFTMMFCPENPRVSRQWQLRWPFLGPEDYGFMMENYGHDGYTDENSLGIGEFSIYDWGSGAAAEAYLRIDAHLGPQEK